MIGSASQCPGTAPSSPLGRAQTGGRRPGIRLLPLGSGSPASGERGCAAGASGAQGPLHPQLGAQAAGALDAPGPLGGSAREQGRMLPSSGFSNRRRAAIRLGPAPIPRAGRRPARAGPDWRPACGSWGGPRAPGPRPAPPPGGRPRPGRPRGGSRPTRSAGTGRTRRAMRAAQVPLRQARGDHGPLTGPQAQAPTGAPAAPARRVPGDPMAARRPRAALGAGPHRHARTRRRQRGGRGCSYAYRATTCPRPGSTRPRPGRPRPARPRRPRPRTPPACAGRPPGRFHPRPPSPVPRPPPEPTAAPPCATRPAPEPPPTPTSHPQSAPSPAGAPHPATLTPRGTSITPPNP